MLNRCVRLLKRDTRAQDLIEYAIMIGVLVVVLIMIAPSVTKSVYTIFKRVECVFTKDHKWVDRTDGLSGGACVAVKKGAK